MAIGARALGMDIVQTMVGDGQSWSPYKFAEASINEFRKLSYGLKVYVHLPYTINPCLGEEERNFKSQKAIYRRYVELSDVVGAHSVVIHPGFKKTLHEDVAKKNLIKFFDTLRPEGQVRVLIEVDSGSKNGSMIGSPEFIKEALQALGREQYGMVLDTEHLYARGRSMWDPETRQEILEEYGGQIEMVHLNTPDPGVELGSHLDRHSTAMEEFVLNSDDMVRELAKAYPLIVERASIAIAEKDLTYVRRLTEAVASV